MKNNLILAFTFLSILLSSNLKAQSNSEEKIQDALYTLKDYIRGWSCNRFLEGSFTENLEISLKDGKLIFKSNFSQEDANFFGFPEYTKAIIDLSTIRSVAIQETEKQCAGIKINTKANGIQLINKYRNSSAEVQMPKEVEFREKFGWMNDAIRLSKNSYFDERSIKVVSIIKEIAILSGNTLLDESRAIGLNEGSNQNIIKMKSVGGVSVIPCKVNGLNLNFIFDTGASNVSLSMTEASFMLKNGYLLVEDIIGTNKFLDANGNINEGIIVNLKEIEIAGLKLYNVKASIVKNNKAPLLLGQTAISKLGKIQLDLASNTLTILPNNTANDITVNNQIRNNNETPKREVQRTKNSIKIGNLEIYTQKITGIHSWEEAKLICENLGDNWRLPIIDELVVIDKYKESIMSFNRFAPYWSSTEYDSLRAWSFDFFPSDGAPQGDKSKTKKTGKWLICAVRDCEYTAPPELSSRFSIGSLEIAELDFPKTMNWHEAIKACNDLGEGWRLPNKEELNLLYKNRDKISGLKISNYWSSSENLITNLAWLQNLFTGYQGEGGKDFSCHIRAVRNK